MSVVVATVVAVKTVACVAILAVFVGMMTVVMYKQKKLKK